MTTYDASLAPPLEEDECCGHPRHFGWCNAIREGRSCPNFADCRGVLDAYTALSVNGGETETLFVCDSCAVAFGPCRCITCHTCGRAECGGHG